MPTSITALILNLQKEKKLWSFIKSKKNKSTGVAPVKAKNGITHSDSTMKVNTLNDQFVSVFNKDEDISSISDMGTSPHPSMNHIIVTEAGVYKLLFSLQVHKAMGPDELPTRLLKRACGGVNTSFHPLLPSLAGPRDNTR